MAKVHNTVVDAAENPIRRAKVMIVLIAAPNGAEGPGYIGASQETVIDRWKVEANDAGYWEATLPGNPAIGPGGSYYVATESPPSGAASKRHVFDLPDDDGDYWIGNRLIDPPSNLESGPVQQHLADPEDAHDASAVAFTPTGPIAATNVQDAIVEAATEAAHPDLANHNALGLATQAELDTEAADRAAADALLIPLDQKGAADGVATLGPDSKIPTAQLPPLAINDFLGTVASQAAMLALVGQRGDWAVRTDTDPDEAWTIVGDDPTQLASWQRFGTFGGVLSVNGQTGAVVLPVDGAAGTASLRTLGNGATQAAAGADLVAEATARAAGDAAKVDKATFDANSILKADVDDTPSALVVPASTVVARKAAGGIVAATMADLRAMLAIVDDTAPAQRVTGLNGLSPRSLVGRKTTSGPPTAGTWAVDDEVLDSDGVRWRCTVAGTPGTWSIFGPLMREIGYVELTTDEPFAFATLGAVDTDVVGFTVAATVGTRPIEIVLDTLINNDSASASTTVKVKEGATEILRVAKEGGITANQLCARPKRRRLGGPSQPSPGPHTYKVTCAVSAGTGHIRGDVNPASVQIFEL